MRAAASPLAATFKGFGFKQVNVRVSQIMACTTRQKEAREERQETATGGKAATATGRRAGGHRSPAARCFQQNQQVRVFLRSPLLGLIYLYLPVLQKESEVGLTCHLQGN